LGIHCFFLKQSNRFHRKSGGKPVQHIDGGIAARALNLADIGAIYLSFQR